jgi:hypothetical protein
MAVVVNGGGIFTSIGGVSSLVPNTIYHYQLVGVNGAGLSLGSDLTFTTAVGFPTVTTLAASGVSATNATFNGTVNTGGLNTAAYFQYGLTTSYGSNSATNNLAATNTTVPISIPSGGLSPFTTYHYRLVGLNSAAASIGEDMVFTTAISSPTVTTQPATSVTSSNAILNGTVNPNGAATAAYFQYGLTTNYGSVSTIAGLAATNVTLAVPGFVASTVITGPAGTNWTASSAPGAGWRSIASSGDGIWQVAVVSGGGIYTSTNAGVTWALSSAPSAAWQAVASSINGTRLAAAIVGGGIYTSTNSGATWTPSGAPSANWTSIASSSDGARLSAVINGGSSIYTSTNGGVTWTPSSVPAALWTSIASSSDGTRLAASANASGSIYISANGGATWTPSGAPTASWVGIASSSDGTRLAAVVIGQNLYTSTNSGATWTPSSAPTLLWKSIASSSDGRRLVAGENNGGLYLSTDGGATWIQSDAPDASWWSIACSADGTRLAAVINGGGIFTSTGPANHLTPNTTYHYRLGGVNSAGTSLGGDLTFTTSAFQAVSFSVNGSVQFSGGAFHLGFTNLNGLSFTVLATTNLGLPLSNWTALGVASETPPGQYQFTDLQATNSPQRFYRVRSP